MINKLYEKIKSIIKENYKFFVVLIVLGVVLNIKLPYYIYAPGGLIDVSKRISIEDSYDVSGSFNLAYVLEYRATIPSIIYAYFNKNLDIEIFDNWLLGLTVIRNTCAHYARIWNRQFTPSFKYPKKLNDFLSKEVKNNQIFFALSVMLVLLNDNKLKDELASLFKKYPNVDKRKMGFTDNWQEFKIWNEQ